MKTLVIYDSAYGNTRKVAEAIGAALPDARVSHVDDVAPDSLSDLDCLIVGSPTRKLNFTPGIHDFLHGIPDNSLNGVQIAAFDTRISIEDVQSTVSRFAARVFLHRYAAQPIANMLQKKGGTEITAAEGFYVLDTEGPLKEGELERAATWAQEIIRLIPA